jgi:alpha-L-fucosidase
VTDVQFDKYWKEKCIPQVKELMNGYKPAFWWFDTWGKPDVLTDARIDELIRTVKEIDPTCLVNGRILFGDPDIGEKVDYLSMMDNTFPENSNIQAWETMGTMSGSWGYHRKDYDWFSTKNLISKLTNNVARNGNFNLNVGARPDGTFPPASVRRLREIGAWLYVNGEGIYQSKPNPFPRHPSWGDITMKDQGDGTTNVYCFVAQWPTDGRLTIHAFIQPERAYVLESGQELEFINLRGLTVRLPPEPVDEKVTTIVLEFDSNRFSFGVAN